MEKRRWKEIETLFHQLTESTAIDQERILSTLLSEDSELHSILLGLLESDQATHRIFSESPQEIFGKLESENDLIGEHVGAFRLESIIGNGAMGTVFLAKRNDGQFDQTVAIKILRPLILDSGMREFFQRERQILAKLNHPNIARLYDGGFTVSERPFFTMEYVSGKSLIEYIKERKIELKERLTLFLQVCKAVQYAHQNLIVHLDLKPQNIIVNEEGQIKLLDFGVSKILEDSEENKGSFTLAYASPEQINKVDAGVSSDIYSLGIILFELVCGFHPYQDFFSDPVALKSSILDHQNSAFDTKANDNQSFISDLRFIFEKATKINPSERFSSVEVLIRDLQAFLFDYPISSKPKSWRYSTRKYLKRNRNTVAAIGVAILLLVFSGVFYTIRLSKERNLAQQEAKRANQITDLLSDVFMAADPNIGGADTITAIQLLNQGYENLEKNLGDEPELYASMISRLAPIFLNLGDYQKGEELSRKAYEINLGLDGISPEVLSDNETQMAAMYYLKGNLDSSAYFSELAITRLKSTEKSESIFMANALFEFGNVLYDNGEFDRADSVYQAALDISSNEYEAPHVDLAFALHMIGANAREKGDYEKAEKFLLEALEMKKELFDEPHLEIAYTYNHLGSLYQSMGKDSLALNYIKMSLNQRTAILGEYHVESMASMANYARTLVRLGLPLEAIPIYEKTLIITESLVGKSHYYYWALTGSLATAQFEAGIFDQAELNYQSANEHLKNVLTENDPRRASSLVGLGNIKMQEKNFESAKGYFHEALQIRESAFPKGHPQIAQSQQALGECLLAIGDYSTAIEYLEMALETFTANSDISEVTINEVNSKLLAAKEAQMDNS